MDTHFCRNNDYKVSNMFHLCIQNTSNNGYVNLCVTIPAAIFNMYKELAV